jgi:hypothetical protein
MGGSMASIEEQLRDRIQMHRRQADGCYDRMDAIMADVETAIVLAERDAFRAGAVTGYAEGRHHPGSYNWANIAREQFPLPKRTREVLREVRDPHNDTLVWRCAEGLLQCRQLNTDEWLPLITGSRFANDAHGLSPERIRRWADLLDNPTRTEEVEADEANPWGDA